MTGTAAAAATGGVAGAAAAKAVAPSGANPKAANATVANPTVANPKAKAAAIDGPTRHIDRKDLPKDMPDLSEAKHPLPAAVKGEKTHAVSASVVDGAPLRATVQIRRIDPWSTLKITSVISVSLFFVWMVAVGLLYVVLDGMGVWDRLNNAFTDIVADGGSDGLVTAGQVFGYAALIGIANMVLFTALGHDRIVHLQPLQRPGWRRRGNSRRPRLTCENIAPPGPFWCQRPGGVIFGIGSGAYSSGG